MTGNHCLGRIVLPIPRIDVLVVEDAVEDVYLLRRHLQKAQDLAVTLHIEETLIGAVQWLKTHTPDVVLLDLSLPDTTTPTEALQRIRDAYPSVPVVVLTGADEQTADRVLRLGAQDFLTKQSIDADRLIRAMRHAMERHRLQQHLQASLASFSSIVERCPEGMLVLQAEHRICYANPAARDMLQLPQGDDVELAEVLAFNEQDLHFDLPIVRANGAPGIGQAHRADTVWEGAPAALIIIRDVTLHREADAALRAHNEHVERVRRMEAVGQLAGGVAHEFNNQLMVIQGFAELSRDTLSMDAPQQVYLERVLSASRRSSAITRQLLSFSRHPETEPQPTLLVPLIEEAKELLAPLLGETIALNLVLPARGVAAVVDPQEVKQMLMNLAINSRDAMPNGGRVEVGVRQAQDRVEVWVEDTGVGMDEETQSRAFEPFFTTKEVGKGTGLGLSTVYALAQHWDATIDLQSTVGSGTKVVLSLPSVSPPINPNLNANVPYSGSGVTILVVEDEPSVREYLQAALQTHGFDVQVAAAPHDVLARPLVCPDLMLVDVVMPGMSGPQMVTKLREQGCQSPVLYLSGYSRGEKAGDQGLSEHDELIAKPVDFATLLQRIHEKLAISRPKVSN